MKRKILLAIVVIALFAAVLWIYLAERPRRFEIRRAGAAIPIGTPIQIEAPLGLPPVPIPADNPPTAETIALGRRLYYDPILSLDNTVACGTCHKPEFGFSDGKPVSQGVHGQKGTRNAPTVFNAAYYTTQFWDGRAPNLEKQAEGPVQNPIEMAHTLEGVEKKLMADPSYRQEFEKAFGPGAISYEKVEKAIASFERTVISGNSPFDRYFYAGEERALNEAAKLGFEVFRDPKRGNCTACHVIGLFTDNNFHNIGVGLDEQGELIDLGRYEVTKKDADRGAFKTPSLRNVALTAPYMHDGSLQTLKEVVDFYIGGGNSNTHLSRHIRALGFLTGPERAGLAVFLEALTGEIPPKVAEAK
ncbi:cytochrome-c peroxidase [Acidobacteria bacterium AH-259-O06]|nr:cytochrome-c peroxidase [Acidobacteria bacterium AH-259-O06]